MCEETEQHSLTSLFFMRRLLTLSISISRLYFVTDLFVQINKNKTPEIIQDDANNISIVI